MALPLLFTSLIAKITDFMTAIFAGLLFITVFAFGQDLKGSNANAGTFAKPFASITYALRHFHTPLFLLYEQS